jgi:pimeloyl-ACP methyl ester carboxylesterase
MADTLVLLRGLTRGKWHWGDFLLQVQQAFPEKKVLAIDLAGNGERFLEPSPVSIAGAVEDIRQQLLKANVLPPYDVVGVSLGGMISLQWLHEYPAELDKVVIMNSSHAGLCSTLQRVRPLAMCRLIAALFMPASGRERIIYGVTSNKARDEAVLGRWIQLANQQPVSMRNFFRQIQYRPFFYRAIILQWQQCAGFGFAS